MGGAGQERRKSKTGNEGEKERMKLEPEKKEKG